MPDIYVDAVIPEDPDDYIELAYDGIRVRFPDWEPNEAHLEVILIAVLAQIAADLAQVAVQVPPAIFRYFGASLARIQPIDAAPAIVQSTWTMVDNAGYTIPADTVVAINASGDVRVPFRVVSDVVVPSGSTATVAGGVTLVAINEGADGNDLPGPVELVDTGLPFVAGITLVGTTTDGNDAEDNDTYQNRLARELALMAPRPILPPDFATLALETPGVWRALALDGYDPVSNTFGNEKYTALAGVTQDGSAIATGVKTQLAADMDARREANFVVPVIDPTYTTVDVGYDISVYPDWDSTDVEQRADAMIRSFLDPATWGAEDGTGDRPRWNNVAVVSRLSLTAALGGVQGIRLINDVTLAVHGGSLASADLPLPGAAPLPLPGTITGVIT